jgi:TM2 domain/Protein of unknown function (DUF2510)
MSLMTNTAPPGWYADPSNPSVEHWWDGTAYNGSRPTAAPAAPPAAPQFVQPVAVYAAVPPVVLVAAYGTVSPKSRTVASILGFFLGGLGVDRFYLGNIGMGVAKLLLGWLTVGIWPLIDWIIILAGSAHDGQGLPVKNWN